MASTNVTKNKTFLGGQHEQSIQQICQEFHAASPDIRMLGMVIIFEHFRGHPSYVGGKCRVP